MNKVIEEFRQKLIWYDYVSIKDLIGMRNRYKFQRETPKLSPPRNSY
jgi:hypothetical protein